MIIVVTSEMRIEGLGTSPPSRDPSAGMFPVTDDISLMLSLISYVVYLIIF